MLKWIETTGRSEEDAIAAALFQLGMDRLFGIWRKPRQGPGEL